MIRTAVGRSSGKGAVTIAGQSAPRALLLIARGCRKSDLLRVLTNRRQPFNSYTSGLQKDTPRTMSYYTSDWPSGLKNDSLSSFFEDFYRTSDTPDAHEKYANQFTLNATLVMASKVCNGYDGEIFPRLPAHKIVLRLTRPEILSMRRGLWEKVAKRQHKPTKIFPFGPNADEVMLYGTVDYTLKDGRDVSLPWAARAHTVEEGGHVKMDYYQVYLDTAAQQPK